MKFSAKTDICEDVFHVWRKFKTSQKPLAQDEEAVTQF